MRPKSHVFNYVSVFIIFLFCMAPFPLHAADMKDYCIIPPYVKRDVQPNVLILMDNSRIMGNEAYGDSNALFNVATDSYDPTKKYAGYFLPNLYYSYSSNQFIPDPNGIFSGNILNWALTSRYDLLQSILVGGKSRSRQTNINTLTGISNSWEKKYNGCIFRVDGQNVTITEESINGCTLLSGLRLSYNEPATNVAKITLKDRLKFFTVDIAKKISETSAELMETLIDALATNAYAAKPLRINTNSISDATQGQVYSVTICAEGGSASDYTWSITTNLPDPANWTIISSGTSCTTFSNILLVTTAVDSYSITFRVTDSNGHTTTKTLSLKVIFSPFRSMSFNIWVCAGNYTTNCNTASQPVKEGIVDMFWDRARFGLEDFNQVAGTLNPNYPGGASCIPANPKESFLTNVENASPIGDAFLITPLVNGMYTAIDYFKNDTSANCNPFAGSRPCLKNYILMITAGEGADNPPNPNAGSPNVFLDPVSCNPTSNPPAAYNLSKNACYGFNNDLRPDEATYPGRQYVSTFIVNTMGVNGNILSEAANAGGGTYYNVTDPSQLREALIQAFLDIIKRAAAGTAASVLASGEGQGANLIQAVFYPRTQKIQFGGIYDSEIFWTGRLANYWYYVDPFFKNSTILEDTTKDGILNITDDLTLRFRYNPTIEQTVADLYPYGSTSIDHTVIFENVKTLWEAGIDLWNRDLTISPRTVYTTIDGIQLMDFSTENVNPETLLPYFDLPITDIDLDGFKDGDLNRSGGDLDSDDAARLIRYVKGEDFPQLRSRTTGVDLDGDGKISGTNEEGKVWKLGDVLNSTPKISSWIPLSNYHRLYSDGTYGPVGQEPLSSDPPDPTHYITTAGYKGRGMVFAGGNDGMLHAFKLGTLKIICRDCVTPASLTGSDLGKEVWAFIPKNALPYLKYLTDPGYCHVYTVDLSPYIFDASINGNATDTKTVDSWRTILIGGMRLGGACKNSGSSCTVDINGDGSINDKDCVKTPIANVGYSSYFALDITDFLANQADPVGHPPQLLWEFSHPELGFATTGPAVVRIGEKTKNGDWFVVLGSGPTGPISTSDQQFLGGSDQPLKLFIFNLKDGPGKKNANVTIKTPSPSIPDAFAGSLMNATFDSDLDYQDEVIYIPYVKKCTATNSFCEANKWNDGGVLRLLTKKSSTPSQWALSTVKDGIGPVTSAVTKLENKNKGILWLYFGTGRYYFEQLTTVDDGNLRRTLFGVKEPCFSTSGFDVSCISTVSGLTDVTDIANIPTNPDDSGFKGWYITLEDDGNYTYLEGSPPTAVTRRYRTERVITDPLATTTGIVFFTTYKPYDDVCALGGKSFIWALKYDTGGAPGALLKGVALLQVSTGSIEQVNLSKAMTEMGERRTSAMEGVPPMAQGLSILSPPPPVKRTIHMRER